MFHTNEIQEPKLKKHRTESRNDEKFDTFHNKIYNFDDPLINLKILKLMSDMGSMIK